MADLEDRQALLSEAFVAVRSFTEDLAGPLSAEDQTVQSMPDVSPTKWHRGHTSWFFETFLLLAGAGAGGYRPFHPSFGYIFNSYYEAVGARHPRPERGLVSRPGVADVSAYRQHVDAAMARFLDRPVPEETLDLVELGVHHEQQHQELLLMDIKHVLSCSPLREAYAASPTASSSPQGTPEPPGTAADIAKMGWIEHGGGATELGHRTSGFGFDNERPRHLVQLVPFAVGDRLVTCGEWRAFIDDGGYHRPELWLSEGWATAQAQGWQAPLYWDEAAQEVFSLHGSRPIVAAEPVVHVSYFEADAFARWSGARLPTEAEWEVVATGHAAETPTTPAHHLHPGPVRGGPGAEPDFQLFGEAWQWTSTAYGPYPGFRPAAGAVGEYNGKFMVNQQVLRGSACVTSPGHARTSYRNFFPAAARWAFGGVRLARDL